MVDLYRAALRLTHATEGTRWNRAGKTDDGKHYRIISEGQEYFAEIRYVDEKITEYIPLFCTDYSLSRRKASRNNRDSLVKAYNSLKGRVFQYRDLWNFSDKRSIAKAINNGYLAKVDPHSSLCESTELTFTSLFLKLIPDGSMV